MDFNWTLVVPYLILPLIGILGKLLLDRLSRIETKAEDSISESQARQLLVDKIEPLQDDIKEIKVSLNGLIERTYVHNRPPKYIQTGERDRK
jgi:hypothetical protein